jgi:hypothetical protein
LNTSCIETLREITPPFPWLMFVGWIKCVIYFAGTLSSLHNICKSS